MSAPTGLRGLGIAGALLTAGLLIQPADAAERRVKTATRSLAQCVEILGRQDGGWCELAGASIASVFPRKIPNRLHMNTGPSAIIDAWNGAAYDATRLKLYFHGGGHKDYGGNGVYEFDLRRARWTRLTDPAPLAPRTKEVRCPRPVSGPPASHTYDGFIHSRRTDTLWLFPSYYACQGPSLGAGGEYWEFNPSPAERRNGIAPLGWRRHQGMPGPMRRPQYRTGELPDGRMFVGNETAEAIFDPVSGIWKRNGSRPNYGSGNSLYDPVRKVIWSVHAAGLLRDSQPLGPVRVAGRPAGLSPDAGMVLMKDGRLLFWGSGPATHVYDPASDRWTMHEFSGPAPRRVTQGVYSKWVRVEAFDVYAAYADYGRGVWIYRHPVKRPGLTMGTGSIQPFIDRARPGSRVRVPPGIYRGDARVSKPLTLDLEGVRIMGITASKGVLLIKDARGPVVIENFTTSYPARCGNCAGIKIEGENFDVTVRRAHISRAEMGILTDNRGGRLVVEDTLIEDIGHDRGQEPMHLIYAGIIDQLIVRDSILRRSHHFGHIVKSRARRTDILRSQLLGLDSTNSREADLPCGGLITFDRVVIHKGPRSDNDESIAVGMEPQYCGGRLHPNSSFTMTNSLMIFDNPRGGFGHWKATGPVRITNNRFVAMQDWYGFKGLASRNNRLFRSRRAAGLGPKEIPKP